MGGGDGWRGQDRGRAPRTEPFWGWTPSWCTQCEVGDSVVPTVRPHPLGTSPLHSLGCSGFNPCTVKPGSISPLPVPGPDPGGIFLLSPSRRFGGLKAFGTKPTGFAPSTSGQGSLSPQSAATFLGQITSCRGGWQQGTCPELTLVFCPLRVRGPPGCALRKCWAGCGRPRCQEGPKPRLFAGRSQERAPQTPWGSFVKTGPQEGLPGRWASRVSKSRSLCNE